MAAKLRSAKARSAARKRTGNPPSGRGRRAMTASGAWEQSAQVPEERDDELDYQRIVQDASGRSLPVYYDDYN